MDQAARYICRTVRLAGANMKVRYASASAMVWVLTTSVAMAQQGPASANTADRVELVASGDRVGAVSFVRGGAGEWGIEVPKGTIGRMAQPRPAEVEVYRGQGNAETV